MSDPDRPTEGESGSWTPDFSNPVPHGVMPEVPGVRLDVQIGRGGYATVYRARQISVDRDVAVKVDDRRLIQDRDKRRFTREIVAAGAVSAHPHIVTVYDGGTTADDHPFLVMEYYTGGSYSDRMRKSGPVRPSEVLDVGVGIADALAVAHADGILHRDVKPGNILISRYGTPALADFGLAALPRAAEGFSVTMESLTPSYAPPEAFSGADPTTSMDIYSLGVTLYALLVGRAPRSDKSGTVPPLARLLFMLNDPLPYPDVDGAEAIMPVIWRATMFDPAQRYPTATALHDALVAVRSGAARPVGQPVPPQPQPAPPPPPLSVPQRAAAPEDTSSSGPLSLFGHQENTGAAFAGQRPPSHPAGRWWWAVGAAAAVAVLVVAGLVLFGGRSTTGGVAQAGAAPSSTPSSPTTRAGTSVSPTSQGEANSVLPVATVTKASSRAAPSSIASTSSTAATSPTVESSSVPPRTTASTRAGPVAVAKPQVGSCWSGLVNVSGQVTSQSVPCSRPHYWEAYAVGVLAPATATPLAKDVAHDPMVQKTCTATALKSYLGPSSAGTFNLDTLPPTMASFAGGARGFWCLASVPGAGQVTGSLKSE